MYSKYLLRTRSQTSGIDPATRAAGWLAGRSPVSDDVTCVCTHSTECTSRACGVVFAMDTCRNIYTTVRTLVRALVRTIAPTGFHFLRCQVCKILPCSTLHVLEHLIPSYSRNLPIIGTAQHNHNQSVILSSSRRHSHRKCRRANLSLTNPQPRRQSRTRPGETTEQRVK